MKYLHPKDIDKIKVGWDGSKLFCIVYLKDPDNFKCGKIKLSKSTMSLIRNKTVEFISELINKCIDVYEFGDGILIEFPNLSKDKNINKTYDINIE